MGGGSGNSIISRAFSHLSIALIDNGEHFGGTCLNAGCIPTKMFVHMADVAADAHDVSRLGLHLPKPIVDWPAMRDRIFTRIDALSEAGFRNRDVKIPNVTVFRESFHFVSSHELLGASGARLSATRIVIAAGSRPRQLSPTTALLGFDSREAGSREAGSLPGLHDSDSIMRLESLPKTMVIVGGGAVAVEFAHIFSSLGVEVTQVIRGDNLLAMLDVDVSAQFTALAAARYTLVTNATVGAISAAAGGLEVQLGASSVSAESLHAEIARAGSLHAEIVLVAIGRVPNSDTLNLAAAGYDLHSDGRLVVDSEQRASIDGVLSDSVYGLGDVSSHWQLKHVANHEARIVQHNLLNATEPFGGGTAVTSGSADNSPGPVPAAIFSHPQVAYFGLTAAEAGASAIAVTRHYSSTAWGWSLEDTTSFCKLVVDASTGLILGAQIIGPEASILIQPLVLAASHGIAVPGLARSMYWPHPAATEVIENALLDAEALLAKHSS